MYSYHSILECCHVFWSQVEYKIVCFISMRQTAGMESYWIKVVAIFPFTKFFFILGEISISMKNFLSQGFLNIFQQTVHPSDFENKLLPSQ